VTRVQKGDRTAFDLLLVKYQNRVASIVSRFVDSPEDIADVTQEVFIRVFRSINSFRGDSAFYTWLFRIAINHAKSYLQKNKARKASSENECSEKHDNAQDKIFNMDSPESLLSRSQLAEGIENALSAMPAELSVALILREFDGLSYDEIAKVMECPIGTVRSRIFRARELLDNTIKSLSESSI
jgi:RNA polymerase sigma-70 factor (ECF subfamily)